MTWMHSQSPRVTSVRDCWAPTESLWTIARVVRLHRVFENQLPVAARLERDLQVQRMRPSRCEAKRCGRSPSDSSERWPVGGEIGEQEAVPGLHPQRHEAVLDAVEALGILHVGAAKRLAICAIAPRVVRANDPASVPPALEEHGAAVAADIGEARSTRRGRAAARSARRACRSSGSRRQRAVGPRGREEPVLEQDRLPLAARKSPDRCRSLQASTGRG